MYGLQRRRARDVDDEDGGSGDLGEPYRPVRRLGLDGLGAGEGVEPGSRVAPGKCLLLELGYRVAVLRVDEDQDAGVLRELERLEEVVVLGVEGGSLVGHKDLDRGDAPRRQVRQLGLYVVAQVGDGDVEAVVYDGPVPGLLRPGVEGAGEGAAHLLEGGAEGG